MINKRAEHIRKMKKIKAVIKKTTSPFLKNDYSKAYKRMQKELKIYDQLHLQCKGV